MYKRYRENRRYICQPFSYLTLNVKWTSLSALRRVECPKLLAHSYLTQEDFSNQLLRKGTDNPLRAAVVNDNTSPTSTEYTSSRTLERYKDIFMRWNSRDISHFKSCSRLNSRFVCTEPFENIAIFLARKRNYTRKELSVSSAFRLFNPYEQKCLWYCGL